MKISVIIPTYKPKEYIWECLESLKNQTFDKTEFEIILILNGCKEPYYSEIDKYITDNLEGYNVQFIQTNQGGVSNARNIGIDKAKGEYISFIDDDDYISASYLQSLYEHIAEKSIPISNILAFNDGEDTIISYYISDLFQGIKNNQKTPIMHARSYMSIPVAKLIDINSIKSRRFNKKFKIGEDGLFMLSISDCIKYVAPTDEDAIYYRRFRQNSAITRKKTKYEVLKNKINLGFAYLPYLLQPWKYNFIFCLTRYAALLR